MLIEGPSMEACENAEQLVEALFVAKADKLETMVDVVVAIVDQQGAAGEGYRPAPVTNLMNNNSGDGGSLLEEQIGVPNGIVGFIIGRGGESIASMQARTGCKVQIQKENEMQPGKRDDAIEDLPSEMRRERERIYIYIHVSGDIMIKSVFLTFDLIYILYILSRSDTASNHSSSYNQGGY